MVKTYNGETYIIPKEFEEEVRAKTIDEFLEKAEEDSDERMDKYYEYGIAFNDLERIAKDMKGVKE